MEEPRIAAVVLDSAIDRLLDYAIPDPLLGKIRPGVRVQVPVKKTMRPATIFCLKETSEYTLQSIASLSSEKSLVSETMFALAAWMSRYYAAPLRKIVRLFLPPSIRRGMEEKRQLFVKPLLSRSALAEMCASEKSVSRRSILDTLLKYPKGILLSQLLEEAGVSRSPVATLAEKKVVSLDTLAVDRSLSDHDFFPTQQKTLTAEQQCALDKILKTVAENRFETHLLFGITGSGKTEVYLQAIDAVLAQKKTALFLVPEISLTSQTIERLRARFETKVALLHHQLSHGMRRDAWHRIQTGETPLVVGPRSALFSPLPNLGLIIVDEEHDSSYKQTDETPCYHARDVAVMRGKLEKAAVILGSATPSLESYENGLQGKYTLSRLTIRPQEALLPEVKIVDMRSDKEKGLFSQDLLQEIENRFKIGEQSLLFLNRRGFHSARLCKACSHILECPHCAMALTYHKGGDRLSCHLCHFELSPPPRACPKCGSSDALKFRGAGTEQVEQALHGIFPEIRTLRLDGDTTRHRGSHEKFFKQFRAGKADVLIGTQMVAKGLHFPSVTLVGVLNADATLQIPDFRSAEQVFQMTTQVAGRSGRGALPGRVVIQTHLPDHPVIQNAARQDYLAFAQSELETRRLFRYPPFAHLVKFVFSGLDAAETQKYAEKIRTHLIARLPSSYEIGWTAPCGHPKIKDRHRFQFLIKGAYVPILEPLPSHPRVRLLIDPDPISIY